MDINRSIAPACRQTIVKTISMRNYPGQRLHTDLTDCNNCWWSLEDMEASFQIVVGVFYTFQVGRSKQVSRLARSCRSRSLSSKPKPRLLKFFFLPQTASAHIISAKKRLSSRDERLFEFDAAVIWIQPKSKL